MVKDNLSGIKIIDGERWRSAGWTRKKSTAQESAQDLRASGYYYARVIKKSVGGKTLYLIYMRRRPKPKRRKK